VVYYVALPFLPVEGGLARGEAVEWPNSTAAIRRAHAMASNEAIAGAVASSRNGDPNLGEFEDAVILTTSDAARAGGEDQDSAVHHQAQHQGLDTQHYPGLATADDRGSRAAARMVLAS
jgi:hypothetical protein